MSRFLRKSMYYAHDLQKTWNNAVLGSVHMELGGSQVGVACDQALWRRGWKRKESLQLRLWNLNICIEKVDAKCWLAEMTLVMTSLLLARVFNLCLHSRSFSLCADWRESDSSVNGQPQGNWRRNSNSRDVCSCQLSFFFCRQSSPGKLSRRLRKAKLPS